ncbi:hypothetical protein [Soonwooa sp.]|uniref:hypothetical protein n=1 Tax=Soonwooa sp. TaxID=1938592 RepID=UPI00260D5645|nr:hypothetical protein [Soonwooa sp.]
MESSIRYFKFFIIANALFLSSCQEKFDDRIFASKDKISLVGLNSYPLPKDKIMYCNIPPQKEPLIGFAANFEKFDKYLIKNTKGKFIAYVADNANKKIIFREYLYLQNPSKISTKQDIYALLNKENIEYKVIQEQYDNSFFGDKIKLLTYQNKTDTAYHYINISKTMVLINTYYNPKDSLKNYWFDIYRVFE